MEIAVAIVGTIAIMIAVMVVLAQRGENTARKFAHEIEELLEDPNNSLEVNIAKAKNLCRQKSHMIAYAGYVILSSVEERLEQKKKGNG